MRKKIEVGITGRVSGWAEEGEAEEDARARLIFEAEQLVNASGGVRAHFDIGDEGTKPPPAQAETPAPSPSLRDYLGTMLAGGRTDGIDAETAFVVCPGRHTREEVRDELERMVADGEASFIFVSEIKFYTPVRPGKRK